MYLIFGFSLILLFKFSMALTDFIVCNFLLQKKKHDRNHDLKLNESCVHTWFSCCMCGPSTLHPMAITHQTGVLCRSEEEDGWPWQEAEGGGHHHSDRTGQGHDWTEPRTEVHCAWVPGRLQRQGEQILLYRTANSHSTLLWILVSKMRLLTRGTTLW